MASIIEISQGERWISIKLYELTYEPTTGVSTGTWQVHASSRSANGRTSDYLTSVNPENYIWLGTGTALVLADNLLVRGRAYDGSDDQRFDSLALLVGASRLGLADFKPIGNANTGDGRLFTGGSLLRRGPVEWRERKAGGYGAYDRSGRTPPSMGA